MIPGLPFTAKVVVVFGIIVGQSGVLRLSGFGRVAFPSSQLITTMLADEAGFQITAMANNNNSRFFGDNPVSRIEHCACNFSRHPR